MRKIILTLHSIVDVITNSSTVIYTGARKSSITSVKEIIAEILRVAKSDKKVDDLFNFRLLADSDYELDYIRENLNDFRDDCKRLDIDMSKISEEDENDYDDEIAVAKKIFKAIEDGKIEKYESWGTNHNDECKASVMKLEITSKTDDKLAIDIGDELEDLFEHESYRDG